MRLFIAVGANWRFVDGHLFRRGVSWNVKRTISWEAWRCVFCGDLDYYLL